MTDTKPLIVIIPGAFHRPHHYLPITHPLQSLGYTILSVPLVVCGDTDVSPNTTPADDVAALHAQLLPLLDAGHDAVIVAHSYGSNVATACIRGQTKPERATRGFVGGVVGAVWIAGFAFPARGRNVLGGEGEMPLRAHRVLQDGLVSLTEGAKAEFYDEGVPAEVADAAFASLCRFQSHRSMNTWPGFVEAEITVPKMYLLCERDRTVVPAAQEAMAKVGRFDKVVRLASGHTPFLSMPGEVVEAIVGFCREVSGLEA